MYRIANQDVLFTWLQQESDPEKRLVMLEWLPDLAEHPKAGVRVPGTPAPVYWIATPVRGVTLIYLIADRYQVVSLIKFARLP